MVAAGACGGGEDASAEPVTREDVVPMSLSVRMLGGLETTITDRTVDTKLILIRHMEDTDDLFGVAPTQPITEGDAAVLPGVVITNFKGKGSYNIDVGSINDAVKDGQPTAKVPSSVGVEWFPKEGEPSQYQRRVKPCTVEVDDDEGSSGRVRCPDVTHLGTGGPNFSLDFRWKKP